MSIFSKIIAGEIPSYKIAEDEQFYAFLDIFPLRPGHVLVVPKQATDNLFDLPAGTLQGILSFAQPIAKAIEKVFDCNRCGMAVIGLEVPHAHLAKVTRVAAQSRQRGGQAQSVSTLRGLQLYCSWAGQHRCWRP